MDYNEAIAILEEQYRTVSMCVSSSHCLKHNKAIKMAVEALKKQIPMKPIVTLPNWEKGIPFSVDCPTCGNYLTTKVKRCEGCGQLIDWSDYETDT